MDIQRPERKEFIKNLSKLIENSTARVDAFLQGLGWSKERILDERKDADNLLECPFDKDHHVGATVFEDHTRICKLQNSGFSNVEIKDLPGSSRFFYQSPSSSVNQVYIGSEQLESIGLCLKRNHVAVNDKIEKERVLAIGENDSAPEDYTEKGQAPRTRTSPNAEFCLPASYLETMLNVEDRLKLYEYVVATGKSEMKRKSVNFDELEKDALEQQKILEMQEKLEEDRPKSKVEALAELRDYKRRRQSYRAKNPALAKTSATMVIRELIEQQMKYLEFASSGKSMASGSEQGEMHSDTLSEVNVDAKDSMQRFNEADGESFDTNRAERVEREDGYKKGYGRERGDMDRDRRNRDWRNRHRSPERYSYGREGGDSRQADRWGGRDSDRARNKLRDRDRDRDRGWDNERDREKDRDRDRGWDRDKERDREKDRDRDRGWDRDKERDREKDRDRDRGWDRDRERERDRDRERIRGEDHRKTRDWDRRLVDVEGVKAETGELQGVSMDMNGKEYMVNSKEDQVEMERWEKTDNDVCEGERRRRKSRRRSVSRSRSGSRERHKHKKRKEKHKKRKHKRRERSDEGECSADSCEEWVEKIKTSRAKP